MGISSMGDISVKARGLTATKPRRKVGFFVGKHKEGWRVEAAPPEYAWMEGKPAEELKEMLDREKYEWRWVL